MLDKEKKVQGVAVYAEFRKSGQTMQLLITPDAYTNAGTLVPMALHRRVVTPITPKKQWKSTSFRNTQVKELVESGTGATLGDDSISAFTDERVRYGLPYFDEILSGGWTLENKPILTEVSRHDTDDLAKGKTPNKVLYRIHISRKALGFPMELV